MIYWLVQAPTADSDLARGIAPPGLLHPAEQARLARLKLTKRRRDWLIGRWTVKHLLQACIEQDLNLQLPLNAIAIYNDAQGAPVVMADSGTRLAEWIVSISHCNCHAFCAASPFSSARLGADIEHVECRDWRFVADYFTPDEIKRVHGAPPDKRETLITAIWSAKEAALKALHLGLTIDTRQVSCAIDPLSYSNSNWVEFTITLSRGYREVLQGWWRVWGEYVLTLAII